jgi:hypothetical protein
VDVLTADGYLGEVETKPARLVGIGVSDEGVQLAISFAASDRLWGLSAGTDIDDSNDDAFVRRRLLVRDDLSGLLRITDDSGTRYQLMGRSHSDGWSIQLEYLWQPRPPSSATKISIEIRDAGLSWAPPRWFPIPRAGSERELPGTGHDHNPSVEPGPWIFGPRPPGSMIDEADAAAATDLMLGTIFGNPIRVMALGLRGSQLLLPLSLIASPELETAKRSHENAYSPVVDAIGIESTTGRPCKMLGYSGDGGGDDWVLMATVQYAWSDPGRDIVLTVTDPGTGASTKTTIRMPTELLIHPAASSPQS